MHNLLYCLLYHRQLNASGQLFSISNYDIITEISTTFAQLKEIVNSPSYSTNSTDQSVVEIVLARVSSAIRDTGSISNYAPLLVDLLNCVTQHPLIVINENGVTLDSPHCKIASDILSCLFLHYGNKNVMTVALPSTLNLLGCQNQELIRNATSYVCLAAIHNGKTLSYYALQIIDFVRLGNYALIKILPQIYGENKEPFHAHLKNLVIILQSSSVDISEKLSLLHLMSMIATAKPEVLIPHLPRFDGYLLSPRLSTALLNIYMSLINTDRVNALAPFLSTFKLAAQSNEHLNNRDTICKIIANIGRLSSSLAAESMDELIMMSRMNSDNSQLQRTIFHEIEEIGALYPESLQKHIPYFETINSNRIIDRILSTSKAKSQSESQSKNFNKECSNSFPRHTPVVEELDRNTHSLAMQYQNIRSSGSLSRKSHGSTSLRTNGFAIASEISQQSLASAAPSSSKSIIPFQMSENSRQINRCPVGSTETTFPAFPGPITTKNKSDTVASHSNDLVYKFVDHRRNKICQYINELNSKFPIPIQCTIEGNKSSKRRMVIHFLCESQSSPYCTYSNDYYFAFKTKLATMWLHLMFLQMECNAITKYDEVIGKDSQQYKILETCWKFLPSSITKSIPFDTLITRSFPNRKDQEKLFKELEESGIFTSFQYSQSLECWCCMSCGNPEKLRNFALDSANDKVLEGKLKEKKGRWWFLKKWNTKYFTLSQTGLNYSSKEAANDSIELLPAIDLRSIRSVKSLGRGKKSRKSLRKVFEIATTNNTTVILKAKDEKNAEEWLQYIQIAVAHARREFL